MRKVSEGSNKYNVSTTVNCINKILKFCCCCFLLLEMFANMHADKNVKCSQACDCRREMDEKLVAKFYCTLIFCFYILGGLCRVILK